MRQREPFAPPRRRPVPESKGWGPGGGPGCRSTGLLAREEARPEPQGRCHREPRRRREPGPRTGESEAAAGAVTSSLSAPGRRRQQPEPDSLTSRRERRTEREMIISCVESSGKVSPFGLSSVSDFSPSPSPSPDLAPSK